MVPFYSKSVAMLRVNSVVTGLYTQSASYINELLKGKKLPWGRSYQHINRTELVSSYKGGQLEDVIFTLIFKYLHKFKREAVRYTKKITAVLRHSAKFSNHQVVAK